MLILFCLDIKGRDVRYIQIPQSYVNKNRMFKFHKWNYWKQIPSLAKLVVFARKNYTDKAFSSIASKKLLKNDWIYVDSKKINISSSLIRKFW